MRVCAEVGERNRDRERERERERKRKEERERGRKIEGETRERESERERERLRKEIENRVRCRGRRLSFMFVQDLLVILRLRAGGFNSAPGFSWRYISHWSWGKRKQWMYKIKTFELTNSCYEKTDV